MGLDIRLPMGLMFTVLGLLLAGFGLLSNRELYTVSLGININLVWGLVLIAVGAVMLLLGRKAGAATRNEAQAHESEKKA